MVGAAPAIGKRLERAFGYPGRTGTTVLLEEPETFDANMLQEDDAAAKTEAGRSRPGLTKFTDGSRLDSGVAGYAIAWKNGRHWMGIKTTWGTTRSPTIRSAPLSPGHWNALQGDR